MYIFQKNAVYVDVNGSEGPNDAMDQFRVVVDPVVGIVTDMPQKPIATWAGGILGCAQNSGTTCTKCYCGFALNSGACERILDSRFPGCAHIISQYNSLYSDSACTNIIAGFYCNECATQQLSSVKTYKKSGANCAQQTENMIT